MEILRRIAHVLIVGLLGLVTAAGMTVVTFSLVATNPDTIKNWPVEAGIYPKLTEQFLNATNRANDEGPSQEDAEDLDRTLDNSPLDRERIDEAIKSVFTAEYWQGKIENLVDSFYAWLDGSNEELEFEIVFNDRNQELAAALEHELAQQLDEYPVCTSPVSLNDFDPFEDDCLPPGVSPEQAADRFAGELIDDDFLADARLTSDDIELDEEFARNAPSAYSTLKQSAAILGAMVAILATLAVISAKSRLRGLRKTGQMLFGIGLLSWLAFYVANRLFRDFELVDDPADAGEEAFAEIGQPLFQTIIEDITTTGLWVSLAVVLAGMLIWLAAFIWHKVHHDNVAEDAQAKSSKAKHDSKLPKPVKPDKSDSN